MDRISAWIDEKPYRFQLMLLAHTAVFTSAILIALTRFPKLSAEPPRRLGLAEGIGHGAVRTVLPLTKPRRVSPGSPH
jgi:hypothetical protein